MATLNGKVLAAAAAASLSVTTPAALAAETFTQADGNRQDGEALIAQLVKNKNLSSADKSKLSKISARAKRDPSFKAKLQTDPIKALRAYKLSPEALQLVKQDLKLDRLGKGGTQSACGITTLCKYTCGGTSSKPGELNSLQSSDRVQLRKISQRAKTDPSFKTRLAKDPAKALGTYRLSPAALKFATKEIELEKLGKGGTQSWCLITTLCKTTCGKTA